MFYRIIILLVLFFATASCLRSSADDSESERMSDNSSTPLLPFSPNSLAMLRKIPGGIGSLSNLLPLFLGSGNSSLSSFTKILKVIAPAIPSILQDAFFMNTSSLEPLAQQCLEDLNTYTSSLTQTEQWALTMFDASGKPGPGVYKGNLKWLGNFDQCLEVVSNPVNETGRTFHGDTCVVSLPIPSALKSSNEKINIAGVITSAPSIEWHICVPDSCSGQMLKEGIRNSLSSYNFSVQSVVCHRDIKTQPLRNDPAAISVIVLSSILVGLVILGSALDLYIRATKSSDYDVSKAEPPKEEPNGVAVNNQINGKINQGFEMSPNEVTVENGQPASNVPKETPTERQKSPKGPLWSRLLLCFSAVTSGEKILSVKSTPGSLTCLNGIRVLSMGWVILGHTFMLSIPKISNAKELLELLQTLGFQLIINAPLSVDSFFLLSGLLVTYLFLRETQKSGLKCKHMVMYYVHRYVRLTPAYAYVMFVFACLLRHLVDGPSGSGSALTSPCENNWWLNLLYVNNLFRSGFLEECMTWSWYLGNDMQFYIIAPLALIPWALSERKGRFHLLWTCLGCCMTATFLVIHVSSTAAIMSRTKYDYFSDVYVVPWCRIGPFAIGMALAFLLHKTKCKINMSRFLQAVLWLLVVLICGACTLSTYDDHGPGKTPWGKSSNIAFETLFRSCWALALACLVLLCCCGKGGIINRILSWNWWQPLSRLTYGAYIVHPIFIYLEMQTSRATDFLTVHFMVNSFFGYFIRSYLAAFVLAILVEAPVLQLEKLLLR